MTTPTLTLDNGITMPALGFGVYRTPSEQTVAAVEAALETGYRHIDTAAIDALDTGVRGGPEPADITRENFGIEISEP